MMVLRVVLVMLALLVAPAARAAGGSSLAEALALARNGEFRDAARALPDPRALAAEDLHAIQQAAALLQEQESDATLRLYAAARRLDPDAVPPRVALERMWAARPLPSRLFAADLPYFPIGEDTLALPAAAGVPSTTVVTITPGTYLNIAPVKEPRSGAMHARAMGVYARDSGGLALRFRIYFADDSLEVQARRVARWLGALSALTDAHLGSASQARYPVSVWLSKSGPPDAETWNGSIVLRGAGDERSSLEWVRQLTHEWGHIALPGGGGFRAPEAWAAGDLGERLFLPAMQSAGRLVAWDEPLDIQPYAARYVEPPRAEFARTGPVPALVNGEDADAYNHYVGAGLYIAAAYGMPVLAEALNELDGPRTAHLLAAASRALAGRREWSVQRVPGAKGASVICIPAHGRYMLETHSRSGTGVPPGAVRMLEPGWMRWDWQGTLTVRRLLDAEKR